MNSAPKPQNPEENKNLIYLQLLKMSTYLKTSIEDIDLGSNMQGLSLRINSPRSLHACEVLGIALSELEPVNEESVKAYFLNRDKTNHIDQEFVDLRFKALD